MDGKVVVETKHVYLVEFSEDDLRMRQKMLSTPASTEDSRRGRSSRGRQDIQIQRLREFNFNRAIVGWDFTYPRSYFDRAEGIRKEHPKAGEPFERTPENVRKLSGSVAEQIDDAINEINEPPEELPEVRSESGQVLERAVETPSEASFAAR